MNSDNRITAIMGKLLWKEKLGTTKLKSLILVFASVVMFIVAIIHSSIFRNLVVTNLPVFIILFILLLALAFLIQYKRK